MTTEIQKMGRLNKGYRYDRTSWTYNDSRPNMEKVFSDEWRKENKKRPGIDFGQGLLQDLFMEREALSFFKWHLEITPVQRYVAATVIQWLGTNVGFCFLDSCLRKSGYRIVDCDHDIEPVVVSVIDKRFRRNVVIEEE